MVLSFRQLASDSNQLHDTDTVLQTRTLLLDLGDDLPQQLVRRTAPQIALGFERTASNQHPGGHPRRGAYALLGAAPRLDGLQTDPFAAYRLTHEDGVTPARLRCLPADTVEHGINRQSAVARVFTR